MLKRVEHSGAGSDEDDEEDMKSASKAQRSTATEVDSPESSNSDGEGENNSDEKEDHNDDEGIDEWPKRCSLCPQALLLNATMMQSHLYSKKHTKRAHRANSHSLYETILPSKDLDAECGTRAYSAVLPDAETASERLQRIKNEAYGSNANASASDCNPESSNRKSHNRRRGGSSRQRASR